MITQNKTASADTLAGTADARRVVNDQKYSTVADHRQPLGMAEGGPVRWAIDDALVTLRDVLEARGLPCPWEAIEEARAVMLEAAYIGGQVQ